jgi:hypothetical protein
VSWQSPCMGIGSKQIGDCHASLAMTSGEISNPEILRGVYPERDSSVASLPQNDIKRRAQNDRGRARNNEGEGLAMTGRKITFDPCPGQS